MPITIDTTPIETRATVQASFVVSGPATAPTTGNTTIALEAGGPSVAPDSVTGSDPYTINYTFPKTTNKLFSNTGYVHRITIDAETVDSTPIVYLPETNWDFVTIGTPDTGTDIYTDYNGGTWATGDQCVYDAISDPSSSSVTIDATLNWDINPAPLLDQTLGIYRISSAGTKDSDDTINFSVEAIDMALALKVALRNSMLDEITALIDAGIGAGKIRIYDGTRPSTGGTATTLLAELTCSDPSAASASGGDLTLSSITDDASANATGTATWFRVVDSNNNFVMDGDVGTSGADLNLNTVSITAGATVSITSFVITAPNA